VVVSAPGKHLTTELWLVLLNSCNKQLLSNTNLPLHNNCVSLLLGDL
jgi:hypothetical protein